MTATGKVFVGKYDYRTKTYPSVEVLGFSKSSKVSAKYEVIVAQPGKDSHGTPYKYSCLSPYSVKTKEGWLIENVWQFSKAYRSVPVIKTYSYVEGVRGKIKVWEHPAETHFIPCNSGESPYDRVTPEYWKWREKGFANPYAVRYPVGFKNRGECLGSYWFDCGKDEDKMECEDFVLLDYIEARKRIYFGEYISALKTNETLCDMILDLRSKLEEGVILMIVEVDGPSYHPTAPYNKISPTTPYLQIDRRVLTQAINNPNKPFGHCYVLAAAILGLDVSCLE